MEQSHNIKKSTLTQFGEEIHPIFGEEIPLLGEDISKLSGEQKFWTFMVSFSILASEFVVIAPVYEQYLKDLDKSSTQAKSEQIDTNK